MLLVVLFRNVIPIPLRDLDHDLAGFLDGDLAAETGIELEVRGHIKTVGLIVIHFAQQFGALDHLHVAGSAGAITAASVIKKNILVDRDVEDRLWFAVVLIGQFSMLELDRAPFRQESNADRKSV